MANVTKMFTFEAAHLLPNHGGKCKRLHGHSYKFIISYDGDIKSAANHSDDGMVIDYGDISDVVKPLIDARLDHWFLNYSLPEIPVHTAEMIAAWIFGACAYAGLQASRLEVTVFETDTTSATVDQDDWEHVGKPFPDKDFVPNEDNGIVSAWIEPSYTSRVGDIWPHDTGRGLFSR